MMDCIRGCTRPCRCDNCLLLDPGERDPLPVAAVTGQLCQRCDTKLSGWFSTVLDETAELSTRIPDDYSWDHGRRSGKISGSPALIRLEILALTDPRTMRQDDDDTDPDKVTGTSPLSIVKVITGWAGLLAEEHQLSSPTDNLSQAVNLINAWWPTVCASDWITDFYDDIRDIHRLLGINRPRRLPRGRCFTCDTPLYKEDGDGTDRVSCPKCERNYDGPDLVKLEIQRQRDQRERGTA